MFDGRKRIAGALATVCIATLGGSVITASPSTADPSIPDVRERVDRLYHQAEQASERYNDARLELKDAKGRLKNLQADLDRQRDRVDDVRDEVAASVVAYYQGQPLTTATQVALSDDPDEFLGQMTTISEYTSQQAQVIDQLAVEADRLEMREEVAERELDKIAETKAVLAEEKAVIDEKASKAEKLLKRLEAEQARREERQAQRERELAQEREQRASRSESRTESQPAPATQAAPSSGNAAAAVSYALAQVGDAYVYGAAGPSAFDCSGLTMMAWAQAGVSLPHSSSAQMASGTPVSTSALQPGDLVFYYSPVSHVGIYIGNGTIVHAANPSTGVQTAPVNSMPLSGAVRPG